MEGTASHVKRSDPLGREGNGERRENNAGAKSCRMRGEGWDQCVRGKIQSLEMRTVYLMDYRGREVVRLCWGSLLILVFHFLSGIRDKSEVERASVESERERRVVKHMQNNDFISHHRSWKGFQPNQVALKFRTVVTPYHRAWMTTVCDVVTSLVSDPGILFFMRLELLYMAEFHQNRGMSFFLKILLRSCVN